MSINCPKCGFYQPKDQYCASCGVDMSKHKPPPLPLWKKVISNWVFQLSALFIAVFALTYWDGASSNETPNRNRDESYLLSKPKVKKANLKDTTQQQARPLSVPPPPVEKKVAAKKVAPPPMQPKKVSKTVESKKETESLPELEQNLSLFFYFVPKNVIENFLSQGEVVSEGIVKLKSGIFGKELKQSRNLWKKVKSKSMGFELDKQKRVSIATNAEEVDSNPIGFFLDSEVKMDLKTPSTLEISLALSSRLKIGGEMQSSLSSNLSLSRSPRQIVVLTGFAYSPSELSDSENQFFESDDFLKYLVEPQFSDDFSDLVLVLQYK